MTKPQNDLRKRLALGSIYIRCVNVLNAIYHNSYIFGYRKVPQPNHRSHMKHAVNLLAIYSFVIAYENTAAFISCTSGLASFFTHSFSLRMLGGACALSISPLTVLKIVENH